MKFRKMACLGCKSGDAAKLCKSPTYVISEATDDSNVIFLLMNNPGRTLCRGAGAPRPDRAGVDAPTAAVCGHGLSGSREVAPARRAEPDIDAFRRPNWRVAGNDDFEEAESPFVRNQRLLSEGSKFWPRRRNRDMDGAARDWD